MPSVWLSLKKSLHCKSDPREVVQPQSSRSITNQFKDVFGRGNKRSIHNGSCSPCSIASTEFMNNTITKEAMALRDPAASETKNVNENFRHCKSSMVRKTMLMRSRRHETVITSPAKHLNLMGMTSPLVHDCQAEASNEASICLNCKPQESNHFRAQQQIHQLKINAVKVLREGDPTRNVVELIFKSSWLQSGVECGKIERVIKVNHTQNTLARFEEYRETIKTKANKLAKKHPRCLADGNEVLSFHGTTIMCSLGTNGLSTLCKFLGCSACNIIRTGFPTHEVKGRGIYTAATSLTAHYSTTICKDSFLAFPVKRAMMVCRVIAGRVHKPLSHESFSIPVGFDSVAGKVGNSSKIEELYVANPRGVLPCFFLIYY